MYRYHDCAERGCDPFLKYAHERTWLLHRSRVETKMRGAGRPRLKVRRIALDLKTPRGVQTFPLPTENMSSPTTVEIAHDLIRQMRTRLGG